MTAQRQITEAVLRDASKRLAEDYLEAAGYTEDARDFVERCGNAICEGIASIAFEMLATGETNSPSEAFATTTRAGYASAMEAGLALGLLIGREEAADAVA
jgi:hypothetical protein